MVKVNAHGEIVWNVKEMTTAHLKTIYKWLRADRTAIKAELAKLGKVSLGNIDRYTAYLKALQESKEQMRTISQEFKFRYKKETEKKSVKVKAKKIVTKKVAKAVAKKSVKAKKTATKKATKAK